MDLLAISGPLTAVFTPWVVLLTSTISPVDPFYFILDDMFGNRYERTGLDIVHMFLIRCFTLLAGFELARCLGHAGVLVIIGISIAARATRVVNFGVLSSIEIITRYRYFVLFYSQVVSFVITGLFVVISTLFWELVAGWWIVINRFEQVPSLIYVIIVSFCITLTIGFEIALFIIAKIGEDILGMISKVRLSTKRDYVSNCNFRKWRKILWLTAKAIRPITLPYTRYISIDRDFFLNTMWNLSSRVIDAVLIIK
jgi:hypothetical protein